MTKRASPQAIKKAIKAVEECGLPVVRVKTGPDGTLEIFTTEDAGSLDAFDQWKRDGTQG